MDTIPNLINLNIDGRLEVVETQDQIIDKILSDDNFDCLFDELGNLLTE